MHRLLSDLAGDGLAVLMISSELPEVLGMADRVLVVSEGQITADIDRADATAENVMYAATAPRPEAADEHEPDDPRSSSPQRSSSPTQRVIGRHCCARGRWPSSACWSA